MWNSGACFEIAKIAIFEPGQAMNYQRFLIDWMSWKPRPLVFLPSPNVYDVASYW
jgi:hypothetical protein